MALGIDLGSFDSKMVELVESNETVQVKALGSRPLFSDISAYRTEKLNKAVRYCNAYYHPRYNVYPFQFQE